jgi:regulator of sirC expression with transglutaminase-like and TPR domain
LKGQKQDWAGEIADLDRALALDPRLGDAWFNRGAARGHSGDFAGELADFEELLRVAPNHSQAPVVRVEIEKLRAHEKSR